MNLIWHVDGVSVGSVSTNRWNGSQLWTSGFAWKNDRVFQWEATAMSGGWYVVITTSTGKLGEYQGATFNLPLEVHAAINRLG